MAKLRCRSVAVLCMSANCYPETQTSTSPTERPSSPNASNVVNKVSRRAPLEVVRIVLMAQTEAG